MLHWWWGLGWSHVFSSDVMSTLVISEKIQENWALASLVARVNWPNWSYLFHTIFNSFITGNSLKKKISVVLNLGIEAMTKHHTCWIYQGVIMWIFINHTICDCHFFLSSIYLRKTLDKYTTVQRAQAFRYHGSRELQETEDYQWTLLSGLPGLHNIISEW